MLRMFSPLPRALAAAAISCFSLGAVADAQRDEQRQLFQAAWKAARGGQLSQVQQLLPRLQEHPLLPYLLHAGLGKFKRDLVPQAAAFLRDYPMFPHREALRDRWIAALARRGMWQQLLQLADDDAESGSVQSRCLVLSARLRLDRLEDFQQQALPLFMQGKSQPKQCDPVFRWLYENASPDLAWQRALLAFAENQPGLARHMRRHLADSQGELLRLWLHMHASPAVGLSRLPRQDTAEIRALAMHGIRRLAETSGISKAIKAFKRVEPAYSFTPAETDPALSKMAQRAVRQKHRDMIDILDMVHSADADTFSWRLVAALRKEDWEALLRWTAAEVGDEAINLLQRDYWQARALMETGRPKEADAILYELALRRDYYGFLAADLAGMPYQMEYREIPADAAELARVGMIPVVARAREWLLLDDKTRARREWGQARKHLDPETLEHAAVQSHKWGWPFGSVLALGAAKSFDILELRFPALYREPLEQAAADRGLDLGWLYGLVRSESVFVEDIRSPAGALGLMQVMPATGAMVARKMGLRGHSRNKLLTAEYNILIGSRYLRDMYDMFNGNLVYATAAYNAGPHRVVQWDRRSPCAAADVWIETIPFKETKQYVKRVLLYSSVYDWLAQRPVARVRDRVGKHWQGENCAKRARAKAS